MIERRVNACHPHVEPRATWQFVTPLEIKTTLPFRDVHNFPMRCVDGLEHWNGIAAF
jgi:hypothetical protein